MSHFPVTRNPQYSIGVSHYIPASSLPTQLIYFKKKKKTIIQVSDLKSYSRSGSASKEYNYKACPWLQKSFKPVKYFENKATFLISDDTFVKKITTVNKA